MKRNIAVAVLLLIFLFTTNAFAIATTKELKKTIATTKELKKILDLVDSKVSRVFQNVLICDEFTGVDIAQYCYIPKYSVTDQYSTIGCLSCEQKFLLNHNRISTTKIYLSKLYEINRESVRYGLASILDDDFREGLGIVMFKTRFGKPLIELKSFKSDDYGDSDPTVTHIDEFFLLTENPDDARQVAEALKLMIDTRLIIKLIIDHKF